MANRDKYKTKVEKVEETESTSTATTHTPKVILRSYRATDRDQVEYIFRSTTVPLVYESIRSKLWAPVTWGVWFVVYTALLMTVPNGVAYLLNLALGFTMPEWVDTLVRVITTFSWAVVGFAVLFITSDRIENQNRIDEALANDLNDPDMYYMNCVINKDGKKVRKEEKERVASHFWVLELDDEIVGMIGLSCNAQDVQDQRPILPIAWKQFLVAVLELVRFPIIPTFLERGEIVQTTGGDDKKKRIFAYQQIPKTATITRWAVRGDLQNCGLSTLLINRAITWASEHDINRVYAMTNETSMAAEQILAKRHGFVIMKRYNLNFFGQYNKLFGCRVAEWMEKNGDKTRKQFQKSTN